MANFDVERKEISSKTKWVKLTVEGGGGDMPFLSTCFGFRIFALSCSLNVRVKTGPFPNMVMVGISNVVNSVSNIFSLS